MDTPLGRKKRSYGYADGAEKETHGKKRIKKPPPEKRSNGGLDGKRVSRYDFEILLMNLRWQSVIASAAIKHFSAKTS